MSSGVGEKRKAPLLEEGALWCPCKILTLRRWNEIAGLDDYEQG